jgi:hypothetical protein
MVRLAALVLFATGFAVDAVADVTPTGPRLILPEGSAALRDGTYTVTLQQVDVDRKGIDWAYVQVTRKDPVHGLLVMVQKLRVGDSLGLPSKSEADTRRRITGKLRELLDREIAVEFDPQAKLLSTSQYPDWSLRWCHVVSTPDGPGCLASFERRVAVPVNEIVLQEKSGKRITLRAANPGDKMPADERCSAHGGRICARILTEVEKKEARATLQLFAADEDWKSKNPNVRRRAQVAYLRLLKESPLDTVVEQNRERIKARAEADLED